MAPGELQHSTARTFPSVAALQHALCDDANHVDASGTGLRTRLHDVTVLECRRRSKGRLCFLTVSDRGSSGARLELRLSCGEGAGALSPAACAAVRPIASGHRA